MDACACGGCAEQRAAGEWRLWYPRGATGAQLLALPPPPLVLRCKATNGLCCRQYAGMAGGVQQCGGLKARGKGAGLTALEQA